MELFKKKNKNAKGGAGAKAAVIKSHELEAGERALHDWKLMLIVFSLLSLVVVFFDGYLLLRMNQGDFFTAEVPVEVTSTSVNRKILLDANNFFETRQKEYEALKSAASTEIDPSI